MKFKASIIPQPALRTFSKMLTGLQKVSRPGDACYVKLSPKGLILKMEKSELFLFIAKFGLSDLFFTDSVTIESKKGNVIGFSVEVVNIANAMKAACGSSLTLLRLSTRNGQPMLSFQIEILGLGDKYIVTQDCPIQMLKASDLDAIAVPPDAVDCWSVELPPVETIIEVLNRMRLVGGDTVTVSLEVNNTNMDGINRQELSARNATFRLHTETRVVTVDTKFSFCHLHSVASDNHPMTDSGKRQMPPATFRIKALQTALQLGSSIHHDFYIARIVPGGYFLLCFPIHQMDDSHVTCSIWAVSDE